MKICFRFKAKGMDIGVSDDYLNGVAAELSSSEPEDEEGKGPSGSLPNIWFLFFLAFKRFS